MPDPIQRRTTRIPRRSGARSPERTRGATRGATRLRRPIRRRRRLGGTAEAKSSLRQFRQATILAVAITAFFFLFIPADQGAGAAQEPQAATDQLPDTVSVIEDIPVEEIGDDVDEPAANGGVRADTLLSAARNEAATTVRSLWIGLLGNLPKIIVVIAVLLLAGVTVRVIRPLLGRLLKQWEKANAVTAIFGIAIWLLAIGVAVSVLAGDIRALVGSLGLVGLALSWALQTPIESFTGWLLNSFQGYYRVGDRVAVGDVFGDVVRIDFLTTTVWEIGSLERPGFVQAEQPTGRLITFPNNEVLAGSIVNLTRDFPYVWDELSVAVGNGSDIPYAIKILGEVAAETVEAQMRAPAAEYEAVLRSAGLDAQVSALPQIFVSLEESWTSLSIRYLVPARQRRTWKSRLALAVGAETAKEEHAGRIISVYPRQQIQFVGADERVRNASWMVPPGSEADNSA